MPGAPNQLEKESYLKIAIAAAERSGAILRQYWGKTYGIKEKKGSGNLVTEVDQKSEKQILDFLHESCPTHAVIAEEGGKVEAEEQAYTWIVDPLDGTTNYTHAFPMVSISIGLLYRGEPLIGVVYNPILNELYHATAQGGAFLNRQPIAVSITTDLSHSLLATGFAYDRQENPDNNFSQFFHLTQNSQGVRRLGSAALDLAFVAAGRLDGYWEQGLQCWDIAAGALIVQEAGGMVSAYDQSPIDLFSGRILATNGKIHALLSQVLANPL